MVYVRGQAEDYDQWAQMGLTGWSYDDVLPLFKKSEDHADRSDAYHGTGGPLYVGDVPHVDPTERLWLEAAQAAGHALNEDFNGERQEGVGFYQLVVKDGARHSTAKAYLKPALERPNLEVRTGARITRIVVEGGKAVGVEFLENGRPQSVRCDGEVILTSGAIGSPHRRQSP